MKRKILITGGCGYFGVVLIDKLLKKNYDVIAIDPLWYGISPIKNFQKNKNFTIHVGEISDKYLMDKAVKGVDTIVHLSGLSNDPSSEINQAFTEKQNIENTKYLLENCSKHKVKKLIFASSCSVYGFNDKEILNENSPLNPQTAYAKSKIEGEKIIIEAGMDDCQTTILRKATLFGFSSRMRFDLVINIMTAQALTENKLTVNGGKQWRPFIHVNDAADAYIYFIEEKYRKSEPEIYNLGFNQMNYKIIDLSEKIKEIIPSVNILNSHNEDNRSYQVDFKKFEALGLKCIYDLDTGVLDLIKKIPSLKADYKDLNFYNIKRMISYLNI